MAMNAYTGNETVPQMVGPGGQRGPMRSPQNITAFNAAKSGSTLQRRKGKNSKVRGTQRKRQQGGQPVSDARTLEARSPQESLSSPTYLGMSPAEARTLGNGGYGGR